MDEFEYSEAGDHAVYVLSGLNEFRRNHPKLCDFTVRVDGKSFPCHRSLLCLFSSFFRAAITGGFKENAEDIVQLQDVSINDVDAILDYVYTGTLKMNHSNVEKILLAATRLGFNKIVDLCVGYIRHQIDETNCLGVLKLAKSQKYEILETSARQYLNDHLSAVFKNETQHNEILLKDVLELLQDARTHIQGEEGTVLMIVTWLQNDVDRRREHASNLLSHVIWKRLPAPFLLKVLLRHPLLDNDAHIKDLVLDHVRRSYDNGKSGNIMMTSLTSNEDRMDNPQERDERSSPDQSTVLSPSYRNHRPCVAPHEALLLIGGLCLAEAEHGDTSQPNVMCYHPVERAWKHRASWPERGLRGFSVSKYNNDVIVSGGCSTTVSKHVVIKRSWVYDVSANQWRQLADMKKSRSFHSSCQLNCQLYVIGGTNGNSLEVEFYDEHKKVWANLKENVPRMMFNFTVSGCNSKLILIGSGHSSTIFLQCYNPATASWAVLRSPNVPRHLSSPVCVKSADETKIYVSGDNTKKLFVFDPNNNTWSRGADMNNLHSNGNLILLGNDVFHTGGHWEDDGYWDEMESYDALKDAWTSRGALPHLWLYHGCASIFLGE